LNHFSFSIALMTKKLDPKDQYNSSLHTLIPGGIAYDKKAYKEI